MIHQYQLGGCNIVLDVCSGSVHAVDEVAYDVIGLFEDHSREEVIDAVASKHPEATRADIEECYAQVEALRDEGRLFAPDTYEPMAGRLKEKTSGVVKALCLHVAHTCNLNCAYCFASQGKYHGERAVMSFEVGRQALDFLIAHSGTRRNLEVDFFGGEPLMAWDTVVQTVEYARSIEKQHGKHFRFTITTNGLLLDDEKIDYINREMSNCVLSLDGRREVTDRIRRTLNGKSCFDVIVPKFQKLVQNRGDKDYYVRATFTRYNLDFTEDILAMRDMGFVQLSAEPVVTDPGEPYSIRQEDLPRVFSEYDRLCEVMANRTEDKFNFFHFMVDLNAGPCAIKRLRGCGCGNDYVAVEPHGDIYPCHQFVGIEQWKMGNLYDGTFNDDIKTYFSKVHVYSKEGCRNCWAKFFCSGGCNANSFLYEGDVKKPYKLACEMQKKRLECAIALAADRAVKGQETPACTEAPASMG